MAVITDLFSHPRIEIENEVYVVELICTGLFWDDADGSDNFRPIAGHGTSTVVFGTAAGRISAAVEYGETGADGSEVEERNPNADPERHHFCCQSCFESRSNQHHAPETKEKGTTPLHYIFASFILFTIFPIFAHVLYL